MITVVTWPSQASPACYHVIKVKLLKLSFDKKTRKLSLIEYRGQTDRITALPRLNALDMHL